MRKSGVAALKMGIVTLALLCVGLTYVVTVVRAAQSWAQCGADSYIECSGGVRCTSKDQVGCKCYDAAGRVVDKHSCSEASPGEEELLLD